MSTDAGRERVTVEHDDLVVDEHGEQQPAGQTVELPADLARSLIAKGWVRPAGGDHQATAHPLTLLTLPVHLPPG